MCVCACVCLSMSNFIFFLIQHYNMEDVASDTITVVVSGACV